MDYITISEYAKIKGISKQAVYKRLKGSLSPYVTIVNGIKCLSSEALSDLEKDNIDFIEKQLKTAPEPQINEIEMLRSENNNLKNEINLLRFKVDTLSLQLDEMKRLYQDEHNNLLDMSQKMSEITLQTVKQKGGFFRRLFLPKPKE